ncbi:MAG TPA: rhomboid family intramembrane serine protease [Pyrinomonadaceae bacterium]|jgi:rhomboid protease GluP
MSPESRSEEPRAEETERESAGYRRATAVFPLYTVILIAFLVAVFLCQLAAGGEEAKDLGRINVSVLIAGFVKQLFQHGQYWRILTGAALHGGFAHLFFNCYALYVLGKLIETLSNRAHLAIVFLFSAICGGILSLVFVPQSSVGASGGIIGFLGYLTIYGYKRRKLLPEGFLKNMLFNIGFIAVMGISINYLGRDSENVPMVDNFGHLGGLLFGALYGLIQIPSDLYKDPRETGSAAGIFGAASLGIFILTAIFSILLLLGIVVIPFPEIPELIK